LARPETQLPEKPLAFAREFSEKSAMPLAEHAARNEIHAGDPTRGKDGPISGQQFANCQAGPSEALERVG
jgi:hypothetical protein